MTKLINYILMVFNVYLVTGVFIGYAGKLLLGGRFVSLITGIVIGLFVFDFIKHWVFKS